jgi:L-lactate dehydrogenase (cytochrome)
MEIKRLQEQLKNLDTFYSMSTMGNNTIEEVANISSGPKLFQLYVHKDQINFR